MSQRTVAAYGFRFSGLQSDHWLSVSTASHWPRVSCCSDGRADAPELVLDADALELRMRADIPHSELVHPLLGRIASHLLQARGGDGLHAGAVAGVTGAWAVVGSKMAGKSTLLAALSRAGTPIVTDDVLVFSDRVAMAGPRCIDLRPDAQHMGLGVAVRPGDPRHRIALPPIAAEHLLAGVIHLEWSDEDAAIEALDHREAISRLLAVRQEKGYPRDPQSLLGLAALPTVVLRRPRSMSGLDASVAMMLGLLGQATDVPDQYSPRRSARV